MGPKHLIETIHERLSVGTKGSQRTTATVAQILVDDTDATIADWLKRIDAEPDVISIPLSHELRSAHLPQIIRDIVTRLRTPVALGTRALDSPAAAAHGVIRRQQGYTAAMLVEESRMLQVCIFDTLQNNLFRVDFSLVLLGVMTIADEVDSQLAQAMAAYIAESNTDTLPVTA